LEYALLAAFHLAVNSGVGVRVAGAVLTSLAEAVLSQ
jgi:hypothetical protein